MGSMSTPSEELAMVRDYLVEAARTFSGSSPEPLTRKAIAGATQLSDKSLSRALDQLTKLRKIRLHQVHVTMFLPRNEDGERIRRVLIEKGLSTVNFVIPLVMVLAAVYLYIGAGGPLPKALAGSGMDPYRQGAIFASGLTLFIGMPVFAVLWRLLRKFSKWRLQQGESVKHIAIGMAVRGGIVLSSLLLYVVYCQAAKVAVDPGLALSIPALALALVAGYETLVFARKIRPG